MEMDEGTEGYKKRYKLLRPKTSEFAQLEGYHFIRSHSKLILFNNGRCGGGGGVQIIKWVV